MFFSLLKEQLNNLNIDKLIVLNKIINIKPLMDRFKGYLRDLNKVVSDITNS